MNDSVVKDEIMDNIAMNGRDIAYLSALIESGGEINIHGREITLDFITFNSIVAFDFCRLIKKEYNYNGEISIKQPEDKRCNRYFIINLPSKTTKELLRDTKMMQLSDNGEVNAVNFGMSPHAKENEKNFASYVKGLFLSSGKVFLYEGNYLIELLLPNANIAQEISSMLAKFNINCSIVPKGEKTALCIKAGEAVSDFLALCGATESALELKNILIKREMSNRINREANCEAANSDRNALAAVKQVNAILCLMENGRMDKLPKELKEVADYRINNLDASLSTMAKHFSLTKSGLSHRINRILKIAEEYAGEDT